MRKLILIGMLVLAPLYALRFDPVKYEAYVFKMSKALDVNKQKNVDACRTFAEKGKAYLRYLEDNDRDDAYSRATLKACQRNVREFCGGIMSAPSGN